MKKILLFIIVLLSTGCATFNRSTHSTQSLPLEEPIINKFNFQDNDYIIINSREMVPLNLHKGIWKDVAEICLGLYDYPSVENVSWFLADSIIAVEKNVINIQTDSIISYYAYGMTKLDYDEESGEIEKINIIIEEDYWFVSDVISHESAHGITGDGSHGPWIWNCTMSTPFEMPLRIREGSPDI